tara:strand:+ start:925 stop:1113 length:189 start_codon:yes stop_codon:yes gene_type:complete
METTEKLKIFLEQFKLCLQMVDSIICYIWYRMIKIFRQFNTSKFKVIGKLEEHLPFSPFYGE